MHRLLLTNAQLIQIDTGEITNGSIFIEGDTIKAIYEPQENIDLSMHAPDYSHLDVQGKFVIPGLIDSHVHIKESYASCFVAAGITAVRNTGGNVLELQPLIQALSDAPTPSVYSADRIIDGSPGLWGGTSPWNFVTSDTEQAIQEVKRQVQAGADFIKVYGWLSKDVMEAVVNTAKLYKKEVSCDLIYAEEVHALDAANMGITWNEHASGIVQILHPNWSMKAGLQELQQYPISQPNLQQLEKICLALIDKGVKLCPTMVIYDQITQLPHYWSVEHVITQALLNNEALINQWQTISQYTEGLSKLGIQSSLIKCIAKLYHDLGGTVVAGTDTPAGIWTWPGLALHRELQLFVESGFNNLEALQAATIKAAQAIGVNQLGLIKAGYKADLVILNSNPLENIQHTLDIDRIIKGGQLYTPSQILERLPAAEVVLEKHQRFIESFAQATGEDYLVAKEK